MADYAPQTNKPNASGRNGPLRPAASSASGSRGAPANAGRAGNQNDEVPGRPQTMDDRRHLRHEYRGLIDKISNARGELEKSDKSTAKQLGEMLDTAEGLFGSVKKTREAAMDVEFVRAATEVALKQASSLGSGTQALDSGAVLAALKDKLENPNELERWIRTALPLTSMTATFLYGPLDYQPKEKEKKQIVRHKDAIEERKKLGKADQSEAEQKNESTKRVEVVYEHLRSFADGVPLFKFILDPKSYSNTMHNLFHFSFLIKDGHASVTIVNGQPYAKLADPPTEEEYNAGRATRKQAVITFNHDMWQHLVDRYGGELQGHGILPMHESAPASSQTGKATQRSLHQSMASNSGSTQNVNGASQSSQVAQGSQGPRQRKKRARATSDNDDDDGVPDEPVSRDSDSEEAPPARRRKVQ